MMVPATFLPGAVARPSRWHSSETGLPVLGVVYAPVAPDDRGDLIAWAQGARLTRNGQPIVRPSKSTRPIAALNADSADYARHNHCSLGGLRLRAIPSPAYRLALAAVGEVDAAISLAHLM